LWCIASAKATLLFCACGTGGRTGSNKPCAAVADFNEQTAYAATIVSI
jgi:hypothetical protein